MAVPETSRVDPVCRARGRRWWGGRGRRPSLVGAPAGSSGGRAAPGRPTHRRQQPHEPCGRHPARARLPSPVQRGSTSAADALDAAAEALAAGEAIGLFPEGRITRDPGTWPERANTGAVRLALRTGAPIVPVAMNGADKVVGDRGRLVRTLPRLTLGRPRGSVGCFRASAPAG
ncbi:MAG: 1-acyl-sn-glycerol-3-phosphate acyltransferase [Nostocoides sp.]